MNLRRLSPLLACYASCGLGLLAACTTIETRVDVDTEMDFSSWRSYAWYPSGESPTGHPRIDNPLFHARLEQAIDRALAERGFHRVDPARTEPDFYVQYHLSTERRLDVVELDRGYGRGPRGRGWGGRGWAGTGRRETHAFEYEVGTLLIDLVDVARRQLVWRGSGSGKLAEQVDPETAAARIDGVVGKILAPLPSRIVEGAIDSH